MSDKKKLSPMMGHYKELKTKYPDTILMYRLGDFYEMFYEDAETASKALDITLTGRDCGLEKKAPMCGVPYHSVDGYISKLVSSGYKVAICEQLSAPGDQKGLLQRDIVRVITAGTNTDDEMLDGSQNHYLASVSAYKQDYAVALLDILTGEFTVKEFPKSSLEDVEDYLLTHSPSEIISSRDICALSHFMDGVIGEQLVRFTPYYDYAFDFDNAAQSLTKHFGVFGLEALGMEEKFSAVCASGAMCDYIYSTQKRNLSHINRITMVSEQKQLQFDYNTIRNLELVETQADGRKIGSLLWVLDKTKTGMGARLLRQWVLHPLQDIDEIELRQNAVQELVKSIVHRNAIGNLLSKVRDVERLVTKVAYGTIMPKDCLVLANSMRCVPNFKMALGKFKAPMFAILNEALVELPELVNKLDDAIKNEPSSTLKDGGYIKNGYNEELDMLTKLTVGGQELIRTFEAQQKEITGVSSLKVSSNRIFGYYIEIANSKMPRQLPEGYVRKQTIAGGERFVSDELLHLESDLLGASERRISLEEKLYAEIKKFLNEFTSIIQKNAQIIAVIDCLYSLAETAVENNFIKPKFLPNSTALRVTDGRHPVIESILKSNEFVPNDANLDCKDNIALILTGPNMAGKSTFIRQIALLTVLAHIGSFVPASKMELGVVDKIFTRVGASDRLMRGQSTFMVEMLEVANILNNATEKSLLILDEIGRGTSTLDGLSIAWAIAENLVLNVKAKTLFATHYHELTELENLLPGVKNYRILIQEIPTGIVFLYKIARGGANKSFGIEVAAIAGVKKEVTTRAKEILAALSETHALSGDLKDKLSGNGGESAVLCDQFSMFPEDERFIKLKKILTDTDINRCTPIEALTILSDMKKVLEK